MLAPAILIIGVPELFWITQEERERKMKIHDILAEGKPTLSFEVFPPKTEDAYDSVEKAAAKIAKLKPSFMSVT